MSEYFSHDYNARNDLNMKKLFMGEGLAGIGLYWCIVEMLYEKGGYIDLDYIPIIAFDLRTTEEVVHNVIEKYELFNSNDTHFYSNSVLNRLNLRAEKSEKARKSIEARWKKAKANNNNDTDEIRTYNESNTIKEKERKENKSKENEIKENIDYKAIIDSYNDTCVSLQKVKALSDSRKKTIKARINTYSLEVIKEVFRKAEASDFLKGKNDRDWQATFDWLMKDSNFVKVLDGNYDNKLANSQPQQSSGSKYANLR